MTTLLEYKLPGHSESGPSKIEIIALERPQEVWERHETRT